MSIGNFNTKNITQQTTIIWWVCFILAGSVGVGSFFCPPMGEVSKTSLELVAWFFGFLALAVTREAIKEGLGVRLKHGDTVVEVADMDGKDNNE